MRIIITTNNAISIFSIIDEWKYHYDTSTEIKLADLSRLYSSSEKN